MKTSSIGVKLSLAVKTVSLVALAFLGSLVFTSPQRLHAQSLAQALDTPGWTWAGNWVATTDSRAVGGSAVYAYGMPFSYWWLEATLSGPGTLVFYSAGNLGMGSPNANFTVSFSGWPLYPWWNSGYTRYSVDIPAGQHTVRWDFSPGESGITVYLDNVSFTPAATRPILSMTWSNGYPRLSLTGDVGGKYAIDYVSSLTASNNWQSLITNTLTTNSLTFTDTNALGSPSRFYRARLVP